jgi:hypothetical protein
MSPIFSSGQKRCASSGVSHSLSTPAARLAWIVHRVREHQNSARREHDVVIEGLREALPHPERVVVEGGALREQVVGADDGGIAAGVAAADPALFEYRDAPHAMLAGEVISRSQPMAAAADDQRVVRRLRLGAAPLRRPAALAGQPTLEK